MHIRPSIPTDHEQLAGLIARFRVELSQLHLASRALNLEAARAEATEYQQGGFPTFVSEDESGNLTGYLVCRVAGDVVWAESLYVLPHCRRQGIASYLYAEAEKLAYSTSDEAPYNWVHPNNTAIIRFLQQRGYDVLNLIEVRRPREGEQPSREIYVGQHKYKYE